MKNTIFLLLCLVSYPAFADRPINEQPMYGGKHNPQVVENKKLSMHAAKLGWQYLYKGDLTTAIKRFNQAWMFNRNNAEAYWGFGLVMGRRAIQNNTEYNLNESIKYLEKANQLSAHNSKMIVDLAFSKTLLGAFLKEGNKPLFNQLFLEAGALYTRAQKINGSYPALYYNWSVLKFYEENYSAAKSMLIKAKDLGYKADPSYEKDLNEKLKNS